VILRSCVVLHVLKLLIGGELLQALLRRELKWRGDARNPLPRSFSTRLLLPTRPSFELALLRMQYHHHYIGKRDWVYVCMIYLDEDLDSIKVLLPLDLEDERCQRTLSEPSNAFSSRTSLVSTLTPNSLMTSHAGSRAMNHRAKLRYMFPT